MHKNQEICIIKVIEEDMDQSFRLRHQFGVMDNRGSVLHNSNIQP